MQNLQQVFLVSNQLLGHCHISQLILVKKQNSFLFESLIAVNPLEIYKGLGKIEPIQLTCKFIIK